MPITVGQIYRDTILQEGGPSMTPQAPNRYRVTAVNSEFVSTLREGETVPTKWSRDTFERQFELIAD